MLVLFFSFLFFFQGEIREGRGERVSFVLRCDCLSLVSSTREYPGRHIFGCFSLSFFYLCMFYHKQESLHRTTPRVCPVPMRPVKRSRELQTNMPKEMIEAAAVHEV